MIKPEVAKMLNEQINKELFSAYFYLAVTNYYSDQNLNGFANWFMIQTQEERDHAMLIREFLLNEGEQVHFTEIAAPKEDFKQLRDPLAAVLAHEKYVTKSIVDIYAVAHDVKDYRAMQFLDWFVSEQSEEEKNASDLLARFDLFAKTNLYALDNEMGARVYTAPSLVLG